MKNGFGRYIVQIGGTEADAAARRPGFGPDVDSAALADTLARRGRAATAGPPGIPADRLDAAARRLSRRPQRRGAKGTGGEARRPVEPAGGDEVSKLVKAALDQTPETINLIKEGMRTK